MESLRVMFLDRVERKIRTHTLDLWDKASVAKMMMVMLSLRKEEDLAILGRN